MLTSINQHAVIAKMVMAPAGVAALIYWISREQTLPIASNPALLLAGAALALLSMVPFALRLREVLKIVDFDLSTVDSVRVLTQSMFYYFFVPLSVGTEVSKFAKLGNLQPQYPKTRLASGIVLDHIVGLTVLIAVSLSLYLGIEPVVLELKSGVIILLAGCTALLAAGVVVYLLVKRKRGMQQLLALSVARKRQLATASLYSLIMHLVIAAAVLCGAQHWHIEISYLQVLFVLTGAFLFQMVPINVIGVSAIEIAGAGLYLAVGLTAAEALGLVSLLYCYRILIALLGGLWEFVDGWRTQQSKDTTA